MSIKNISVFCGAHLCNNPIYASEAKKVAEVIVEKGMNVVFGGGDVGLIGVVSHTAIDNGGEVLGISLQSLYELELTNPRIQEVVVAQTLLERKDIFMQRSDAFLIDLKNKNLTNDYSGRNYLIDNFSQLKPNQENIILDVFNECLFNNNYILFLCDHTKEIVFKFKDLESRFNSIISTKIEKPDDQIIEVIINKFF